MDFPLSTLPDNVFKAVAEKMTFITLCRLRRSQKEFDLLVEKNRSSIQAMAGAECDIIEIDRGGWMETHRIRRALVIYYVFSSQNFYFQTTRFSSRTGPGGRHFHLTPESLSAIYFNSVYVDLCEKEGTQLRDVGEPFSLGDLKQMRMACEELRITCLRSAYEEQELEKILSNIQFSRIDIISRSLPLRFLINPLIQHCSVVSFKHSYHSHTDNPDVLRFAKIKKIIFVYLQINIPVFVNGILQLLNRKFIPKGGTEHICFKCVQEEHDFSIFEEYMLWKGKISFLDYETYEIVTRDTYFYTVTVRGRIVLMIRKEMYFDIEILKDASRESLVICMMKYLMVWTPWDISTVWDELLTTDDLPGAIEKFMEGFKAEYLFESLY